MSSSPLESTEEESESVMLLKLKFLYGWDPIRFYQNVGSILFFLSAFHLKVGFRILVADHAKSRREQFD